MCGTRIRAVNATTRMKTVITNDAIKRLSHTLTLSHTLFLSRFQYFICPVERLMLFDGEVSREQSEIEIKKEEVESM